MRQLLEFIPVAAFFGVYLLSDIYDATIALMVASAAQVAFFKLRRWSIPAQMWVVFWGAIVFGALTLAFRNALFIQWKPTIVNWTMALVLIGSRFFGNGEIIARALGKVMVLPARAWRALTWGWAGFFVFTGAANLYVAYQFSEPTWVTYKFVVGFVIPIVLLAGSIVYLVATRQLPALPADDADADAPESSSASGASCNSSASS